MDIRHTRRFYQGKGDDAPLAAGVLVPAVGLDQRRKRPLTDMTPEEETTEAGEAVREEEVMTLVVPETPSTAHVACKIHNHSDVLV